MKLDKWPEEVEQGGWRWRRKHMPMTDSSKDRDEQGKEWVWWNMYEPIEKLHVPPTMREIMEHLLKGGWVRNADHNTHYYYLIDSIDGSLLYCDHDHKQWSSALFFLKNANPQRIFLIQPNEWLEGEGK